MTAGVALLAATVAFTVTLAPKPVAPDHSDYTPPPVAETSTLIRPNVVFIGDSFVGGSEMGGNGPDNWTTLTSQELGWTACSLGVGGSGWTRGINDWTFGARIDWALTQRPAAIVFANGINDLNDGGANTADAMRNALAYLRSVNPTIPVIVLGPIKVRDEQSPYIERMDDDMRATAAEFDVTYLDATEAGWFDGEARAFIGSDEFHPTDEGHAYLAQRFAQAVTDAGVALEQQPKEGAVFCSPPAWQTRMPDGTAAPVATPGS